MQTIKGEGLFKVEEAQQQEAQQQEAGLLHFLCAQEEGLGCKASRPTQSDSLLPVTPLSLPSSAASWG